MVPGGECIYARVALPVTGAATRTRRRRRTLVELTSISMPIRQTLNLSPSLYIYPLQGNHEEAAARCAWLVKLRSIVICIYSNAPSFSLFSPPSQRAAQLVLYTCRSITICIGRGGEPLFLGRLCLLCAL